MRALIASSLVLCFAGLASAAPITVYNTGQGQPNGSIDSHWNVSSRANSPAGPFSFPANNARITTTGSFPFGFWTGNSSTSQWIMPAANITSNGGALFSHDNGVDGYYDYRTTFDLTGFDANSTQLQFRLMSDNDLVCILLNGQVLPGNYLGSPGTYQNWSPTFTVNSSTSGAHFLAGINTLDFIVRNLPQSTGNPTGFRLEFLSATGTPAPEPGSLALFGVVGAATLCYLRKRRK